MQILERLIGQRIFWVLSGVLPLALFAVWMFVIFTDQQESAINQLIEESAASAAHNLDRTLQQQIGLLEGLAIARSLDTGDFEQFRTSAQRLKDKHPEWRTVILTDSSRQLFNLRRAAGQPLDPIRDRRSLETVWQTRRAVVGDLSQGFVPVRTPVLRADRMQYTLVVPIDPKFFLSALEATSDTRGWKYVIVGRDGVVIAASPGVAVTAGQPLPPTLTTVGAGGEAAAGDMLLAPPVAIPTHDWRVHLMVPADSVRTPFVRARLVVFAGGVVASALTVVLILALSAVWAGRQEKRQLQAQIDERIRGQEVLHRSEAALKEAQRLAEVGSWSWDLRTKEYNWSEELYRIHGLDPALPPAGYPEIRQYFSPESWVGLSAAVEAALAEGRDYTCDAEVVRPDGARRWITARGVAERDGDGRVVCLKGTVQDITARKKAEDEQRRLQQQLVQAQKMESVGRLAGGVAHDFNNILSVIIGHVEIAMSELEPEHRLQPELKVIYDAALRSTGIIRQLLAFSRKQVVAPVILELNEVIAGMLKMLGRLIGEDIELVWVPAPERLLIKIDPAQIDQILANLCVNARDAIADTGRIEIRTEKVVLDEGQCATAAGYSPGAHAVLTVRDNGCGMEKEVIDRIFEPFFTTKGERGTGLGLATVYGIVQQNHGCIRVDSTPGAGTTFTIYFPLVELEEAFREAKEGMGAVGTGGGETVLLVEDDPDTLKMGTAMLQRLGFTVLTAASPGEGIEIAKRHDGRIALLLTDVIMPQMNGRQLTQEILAIHPDIGVIYISGYTADAIAQHGVLDEGIHFLQKPFTRKDLAAKISEALA